MLFHRCYFTDDISQMLLEWAELTDDISQMILDMAKTDDNALPRMGDHSRKAGAVGITSRGVKP